MGVKEASLYLIMPGQLDPGTQSQSNTERRQHELYNLTTSLSCARLGAEMLDIIKTLHFSQHPHHTSPTDMSN